jgi:hypothetical protein
LVPVFTGTGQPAHLKAEDQADMIEGHFGQQTLEAESTFDRLAAFAEVVVDDEELLTWPAQSYGAVDESVLPRGGFLVF